MKSTSVAGVAILVVVMAVGAVALGSVGSSSAAAPAGPRALPACHVLPGRTRCVALPGQWMRGRIIVGGAAMVVVDPDRRARPVTLATITGNPVAWSSDGSELLISDVPRLKVLGIGGAFLAFRRSGRRR